MIERARVQARGGGFGDLPTRIGSALVLGVAAVVSLIVGGTVFVLFWLLAAIAVHWEWQRMVGGDRVFERFLVGSIALGTAAVFSINLAPDFGAVTILGAVIIVGALAGDGRRVWAGAGLCYAGVLILSVCMIRPAVVGAFAGPFDLRAIVWLFAVVWGTDVMAYFAGRLIGGPKVWPAISPGKTWSGTLVGIAFGALAGLAIGLPRSILPVAAMPLFALGLVAASASQAGDFFESGVKRHFGVKDSSQLIPGHGGVMDRLDGFIAAAAVIVLLGLWRDASSIGEAVFRW
jgi:phosphatidate cytidylyltransferase